MPYINITTSSKVEDKKKFLMEISELISSLTNKSKRFVMAKLNDNCEIYFDDQSPCCFLEIKSIGSLNPSNMAKPISDFIYEKIGIPILSYTNSDIGFAISEGFKEPIDLISKKQQGLSSSKYIS